MSTSMIAFLLSATFDGMKFPAKLYDAIELVRDFFLAVRCDIFCHRS